MRIKKSEFTETLYTRIPKKLDDFIISYCTKHNKSKSEFVREAVEHYIEYLSAARYDSEMSSSFDEVFDKAFGK